MRAVSLLALGAFVACVGADSGPERFKKHLYIVSEKCQKVVRSMVFHDQVVVESQIESEQYYKTNVSCALNFTMEEPNVGLIVSLAVVDTVNCQDYLKISSRSSQPERFCGPQSTRTLPFQALMLDNSSFPVQVEWEVAKHVEPKLPGGGFQAILTPYKSNCVDDEMCFPCENGYYIHPTMRCNGLNNCGDSSDEKNCHVPKPLPARGLGWMIFVIILCCAAVLAASSAGVYAFILRRERNELRVRLDERSPLYLNQEEHQ